VSHGGDKVSLTVSNEGKVGGQEVVQLYLTFPKEAGEPPKVLRGFEKRAIAVGGNAAIFFDLPVRSTSVWDSLTHGWKAVKGTFQVHVGASSRDIRLIGEFER
jgi:beta-glucosidase